MTALAKAPDAERTPRVLGIETAAAAGSYGKQIQTLADNQAASVSVDASGNAVYSGSASAGQISLGEGQTVSRGLTGPDKRKTPPRGRRGSER